MGVLANHPAFLSNPDATVHSLEELNALDSSVEMIIIDNNACSNQSFTVLNLTRFVDLKVFEVGDYSFSYVTEVILIGLSKLESVLIGRNSFTQHKNGYIDDPNGNFYLKDCDSLKDVNIGYKSFMDYFLFEIENVPSLEEIEMGDVNEDSSNFRFASLELKSDGDGVR